MRRKRTVKALVSAAPARRVVVALRMAGIAGQDKLNGIFSYLNEGHRWSLAIYRTQHEFTAEAVSAEIARGVDGFLVGLPFRRAERPLETETAQRIPHRGRKVKITVRTKSLGRWTEVGDGGGGSGDGGGRGGLSPAESTEAYWGKAKPIPQ